MKIPHALRFILGSMTVYFLVAAAHGCGSSAPLFGSSSATGAGAGGASPSTTSSSTASAATGPSAGAIMNPVPEAFADSGSRLRVKWTVGDDGSREFSGFWDSSRKEDCSWLLMSDGKRHCAPQGWSAGSSTFADNKCLQPLAGTLSCFGTPKYITTYDPVCVYTIHLFIAGPKLVGSTYYELVGASCTPVQTIPAYDYYPATGAELDPSLFVAGSVVTE